jgi:hypothetical protein
MRPSSKDAITSCVSSVDALSHTISSKSPHVCASTLSIAFPRKRP